VKTEITIEAKTKNDLLAAILSIFLEVDENFDQEGLVLQTDYGTYRDNKAPYCYTIIIGDDID
jgi:hypothetical protein